MFRLFRRVVLLISGGCISILDFKYLLFWSCLLTAYSRSFCQILIIIVKQIIYSHPDFVLVDLVFLFQLSALFCSINKMFAIITTTLSSWLRSLPLLLRVLLVHLSWIIGWVFVRVVRVLQFTAIISLLFPLFSFWLNSGYYRWLKIDNTLSRRPSFSLD